MVVVFSGKDLWIIMGDLLFSFSVMGVRFFVVVVMMCLFMAVELVKSR